MNFEPVRSYADLLTLDSREIFEGYTTYKSGDPEPGPNRGRAFWHGWRNAAMDHRDLPLDDASAQLAHDIAPKGKFRDDFWERVRSEAANSVVK